MSAPMQGDQQPTVYRFKLGGFEVSTILDSKAIRQGLHPMYGANASADEAVALAKANNIDLARFEHPNIPTLVNTGKELVLFDTGNGALPREYEALKTRMPPGNLARRLEHRASSLPAKVQEWETKRAELDGPCTELETMAERGWEDRKSVV